MLGAVTGWTKGQLCWCEVLVGEFVPSEEAAALGVLCATALPEGTAGFSAFPVFAGSLADAVVVDFEQRLANSWWVLLEV